MKMNSPVLLERGIFDLLLIGFYPMIFVEVRLVDETHDSPFFAQSLAYLRTKIDTLLRNRHCRII